MSRSTTRSYAVVGSTCSLVMIHKACSWVVRTLKKWMVSAIGFSPVGLRSSSRRAKRGRQEWQLAAWSALASSRRRSASRDSTADTYKTSAIDLTDDAHMAKSVPCGSSRCTADQMLAGVDLTCDPSRVSPPATRISTTWPHRIPESDRQVPDEPGAPAQRRRHSGTFAPEESFAVRCA
jgi:hypothetical protein